MCTSMVRRLTEVIGYISVNNIDVGVGNCKTQLLHGLVLQNKKSKCGPQL